MRHLFKASISLTVVGVLNTLSSTAYAGPRCVADLSRVDPAFCVNDGQSLNYSWSANDTAFDLSAKLCLVDNSGVGNRRDLVFALDRSQSIWGADAINKKLGADQVAMTKAMLATLRDEAKANPDKAPKVGLMAFSVDPACQEWAGEPIVIEKTFPCRFVKAATLVDDAHYAKLEAFLAETDGKYAQGGLAQTSDVEIVASLLADDQFALASSKKAGLVLMSDGRSYKGAASDQYAYLRSGAYAKALADGVTAFSKPALKGYEMIFALAPIKAPAFDETHADGLSVMCKLAGAEPVDCTAPVDFSTPMTWPSNKLDGRSFAEALTVATGTPADRVFELKDKASFDLALDKLRITETGAAPITGVSYSVAGGAPQPANLEGVRFTIPALPTGQVLPVELLVRVNTQDVKIPLNVMTELSANAGVELADKEMFCLAGEQIAPAIEKPKLSLDDLQGGSGSCGVAASASGASKAPFLGLFLLLPAIFALARRQRAQLAAVAVAGLFAAEGASADEAKGLNAMHHRPVLDGAGNTEKASGLGAGQLKAGLFLDYANDAVELSGKKGKRLDSVVDDLASMHAVFGLGLHKKLSLGLDLPYVHKTDIDRRMAGDSDDGQKLGRPSDAAAQIKFTVTESPTFAFALIPTATIPMGEPENLTGDGTPNYGALLAFSGSEGLLNWGASVGYLHRQEALVLEDDRARTVKVRGQFPISMGLDYQVARLVRVGGNLQFKPTSGERIDFSKANPAEWQAIGKLRFLPTLETTLGFGTGIGKGYGSPDYRVFAGVSWVPGASVRTADAPRAAQVKAKAEVKPTPAKVAPVAAKPVVAKLAPVKASGSKAAVAKAAPKAAKKK